MAVIQRECHLVFIYLKISKKGPHGQVRGLRESIVLAIKLNRTLVIPTFFIDGWDDPVQLSSALVWDESFLNLTSPVGYGPKLTKIERKSKIGLLSINCFLQYLYPIDRS